MTTASEPPVRVVMAQEQSILRSAGEHAIGLDWIRDHEIIDEDTDICLVPAEKEGRLSASPERCVCSRDQALRARLFIAGGPIDLSRQIEPGDLPHGEGPIQLAWLNEVILDGVAMTEELSPL
jgi:hypothetical protein